MHGRLFVKRDPEADLCCLIQPVAFLVCPLSTTNAVRLKAEKIQVGLLNSVQAHAILHKVAAADVQVTSQIIKVFLRGCYKGLVVDCKDLHPLWTW